MKKSLLFALGVAILLLALVSCAGEKPSVVNPSTTQVAYDFSAVVTVGNRSFIPINKVGKPSDNPSLILNILKEFEKEHPGIEIVDWKIEKEQDSYSASDKIFGIWVDHRPKSQ